MAVPASEPLAIGRYGGAARRNGLIDLGHSTGSQRGDQGPPKATPVFKAAGDAADIGTVNVPNLRAQFGELLPKKKTVRLKGVGIGRKSVKVGLDIGSSAVRAAEVAAGPAGAELRRFAQVGLSMGAVVEGEVRDEAAVADAIRRLWAEGGFSQKEVVLGISSQRAMVRQLEMPEMTEAELRSALRYEIGELLPIPVEEAVFDFAILGPGRPKADGGGTTQVLVVVAQRDIVWDSINVAKRAGLRVRAVDSSPLALLRAVPLSEENQDLEAVVSIGSHLVVVAVREGEHASVPPDGIDFGRQRRRQPAGTRRRRCRGDNTARTWD